MDSFFTVLQRALDAEDGLVAQRTLVVRVLSAMGCRDAPERRQCTFEGRSVALHVWPNTPAGGVALLGGLVTPLDRLRVVRPGVVELAPDQATKELPPQGPASISNAPYGLAERIRALPSEQRQTVFQSAGALHNAFTERLAREAELRKIRAQTGRSVGRPREARAS